MGSGSTSSLRPGARVDRYEIVSALGAGGMGRVFVARHVHLDKRVALKLLAPGRENDADAYERFRREAQALSALRHPHIVEVSDFGVFEGAPFLVMELLSGPSLADRLDEGPIGVTEAVQMILPILDALQLAHDRGIIHRDVKPQNLVFADAHASPARLTLVDFGISRWIDRTTLTATGQMIGTPRYIAPEQREVGGAVDGRADVYAVAMVLHRMIAGRLPGERDAATTAPARPERASADHLGPIGPVIRDALSADPERRPPSPSAFKERLLSASERPRAGATNARGRTGVLVALAIGALLGAAVGVPILLSTTRSPAPDASIEPRTTPPRTTPSVPPRVEVDPPTEDPRSPIEPVTPDPVRVRPHVTRSDERSASARDPSPEAERGERSGMTAASRGDATEDRERIVRACEMRCERDRMECARTRTSRECFEDASRCRFACIQP
ncbi:MAG: serine/threonine-protein kinase [Sandaracinaceae bacterium]